MGEVIQALLTIIRGNFATVNITAFEDGCDSCSAHAEEGVKHRVARMSEAMQQCGNEGNAESGFVFVSSSVELALQMVGRRGFQKGRKTEFATDLLASS